MKFYGDVHSGLTRTAGTTIDSQRAFERHKVETLRSIIAAGGHLVFLGDLFDGYSVPMESILRAYQVLSLARAPIWILAGNHDLAKDSEKLSGFLFLKNIMQNHPFVTFILEPTVIGDCYIVPHCINQEAFDKAVAERRAPLLITHANYENGFAAEKDHSLNLTKEQATLYEGVISGHEHMPRDIDNVLMVGSMFPSTVDEAGVPRGYATEHGNWLSDPQLDSGCVVIDWDSIDAVPPQMFIKVTGTAAPELAGEANARVAELRKISTAYMIRNAITFESQQIKSMQGSVETMNTMDILQEVLPEEHRNHLKELGYEIG